MASDDEEEAYEVERILAEKPQDGETKYLVKWKGYDDEECTWEPLESFDTTEVLDLWKKQKADGDVLEKEDLRRIELQMDAFQKARSANSNPSEHSSEGDSDPESDELLQPPAKRVKLVRKIIFALFVTHSTSRCMIHLHYLTNLEAQKFRLVLEERQQSGTKQLARWYLERLMMAKVAR